MKTLVVQPQSDASEEWSRLSDTIVTGFFEKARIEYLTELASQLVARSSSWVQASLHLDYLGSYQRDHEATIDICVTEVGNTSFTLSYRIYQRQELRVTGNCVLVNIDHHSQRPVRLCTAQRRLLNDDVLSFYRMQKEDSALAAQQG